MTGSAPTYDLGSIVAVIRRRVVVVVLLAALAFGAGLVLSLLQSDRYEATSVLLFRPTGSHQIFDRTVPVAGNDISDGDTYTGLVSLGWVAQRTEGEPGVSGSAADVSGAVTVGQGAGPQLVEVTAEEADPKEAAAVANAYARSYIDGRRRMNRQEVERVRSSVQREIAALPATGESISRANALRAQIQKLNVLAALQISDAQIVERAGVPTAASSPKPLRNAVAAGVAGLLLGLIAAFALEREGVSRTRPRQR